MLTEKEILEDLKISRTTLWRLKKKGLPAIKVGSTYRYDKTQILDWIKNNQVMVDYDEIVEQIHSVGEQPLPYLFSFENSSKTPNIKYKQTITISQLLKHNEDYLYKILTKFEIDKLIEALTPYKETAINEQAVSLFTTAYLNIIKHRHQSEYLDYDEQLDKFITQDNNPKIIWGNCLNVLKKMKSESIQLMVTSPPYYNAREYSKWDNLNDYLSEMRLIIRESYRVLDNHRVWVFNIGDVFDNDRLKTKSVWGKRRLPLGAYFIKIFEEEGFEFVDDIIWDKGEVESQRHKNGGVNYPFYQYPLNCYEHILIFHKHRLDTTKIPCPICGSLNVNGNTQSEISVQSWECKNDDCLIRSPHNRGKRFSLRSNMMQNPNVRTAENEIDTETIAKFRRDIVKFPPVIKIDQNGNNRLGHSAPFPKDIPDMAIKYFSYTGEKVLDPFAGSFTTAIVAHKLNRVGIGIEINKLMYEAVIKKRVDIELGLSAVLQEFSF
ncbi:MAG: DNA methyltransferase [Thermodesulfovibrionales bacterium]|nr:DNA methyltransferase [Thermodesulfovibrionales bacterium]